MTTDTWTSPSSGDWSDSGDWSENHKPQSGEAVVIDTTSHITVTFNVASLSIGALTLADDTLDLVGGSLTVTGQTTLQNGVIDGSQVFRTKGATSVSSATVGGTAKWMNNGFVTETGGTVTIGDSTSAIASIVNQVGATWEITDDSGIEQGAAANSRFYNYGEFEKTSGSGIALIEANFTSTGTIASQGGGDIEFDGAHTLLSGTYIGSGMVDYGPDGVSDINGVDVTASCCQTSWGTVDLVGDMTMNDGSTIANGGHWNFDGDTNLLLGVGQSPGPVIYGLGTIAKTAGTGTSLVEINVEQQGVTNVATGTLAFDGESSSFSGAINGAGTFELESATTLDSGAKLNVANWSITGGTTTLDENVSYSGAFTLGAGAAVALDDWMLTLSGTANTTGATTIGGAGQLTINGLLTQSGGDDQLGDSVSTDLTTLEIGGQWLIGGDYGIGLGADKGSVIRIGAVGLLEKSAGAKISTVAPAVVNDGNLEAASGTLDFTGSVTGTGADKIAGAATLEFQGAVGANQTAVFTGAQGTLELLDLDAFGAGISGFDAAPGADNVLLIGNNATFLGATLTLSDAKLTFDTGGTHKSITLAGDYESGSFVATTLSSGLLQVTYSP